MASSEEKLISSLLCLPGCVVKGAGTSVCPAAFPGLVSVQLLLFPSGSLPGPSCCLSCLQGFPGRQGQPAWLCLPRAAGGVLWSPPAQLPVSAGWELLSLSPWAGRQRAPGLLGGVISGENGADSSFLHPWLLCWGRSILPSSQGALGGFISREVGANPSCTSGCSGRDLSTAGADPSFLHLSLFWGDLSAGRLGQILPAPQGALGGIYQQRGWGRSFLHLRLLWGEFIHSWSRSFLHPRLLWRDLSTAGADPSFQLPRLLPPLSTPALLAGPGGAEMLQPWQMSPHLTHLDASRLDFQPDRQIHFSFVTRHHPGLPWQGGLAPFC